MDASGPGGSGASRIAFVITLWLEPSDGSEPPEWRWRVVDPTRDQARYFRHLPELLAWVGERTGTPPPR